MIIQFLYVLYVLYLITSAAIAIKVCVFVGAGGCRGPTLAPLMLHAYVKHTSKE